MVPRRQPVKGRATPLTAWRRRERAAIEEWWVLALALPFTSSVSRSVPGRMPPDEPVGHAFLSYVHAQLVTSLPTLWSQHRREQPVHVWVVPNRSLIGSRSPQRVTVVRHLCSVRGPRSFRDQFDEESLRCAPRRFDPQQLALRRLRKQVTSLAQSLTAPAI